jgi:hypothetical protein
MDQVGNREEQRNKAANATLEANFENMVRVYLKSHDSALK